MEDTPQAGTGPGVGGWFDNPSDPWQWVRYTFETFACCFRGQDGAKWYEGIEWIYLMRRRISGDPTPGDEQRRRAFEAYDRPCTLESGSFPRCPWNPAR